MPASAACNADRAARQASPYLAAASRWKAWLTRTRAAVITSRAAVAAWSAASWWASLRAPVLTRAIAAWAVAPAAGLAGGVGQVQCLPGGGRGLVGATEAAQGVHAQRSHCHALLAGVGAAAARGGSTSRAVLVPPGQRSGSPRPGWPGRSAGRHRRWSSGRSARAAAARSPVRRSASPCTCWTAGVTSSGGAAATRSTTPVWWALRSIALPCSATRRNAARGGRLTRRHARAAPNGRPADSSAPQRAQPAAAVWARWRQTPG